MIPQRQTIFVHSHPKGWGNCQSAAMASVLGLPLSEVIDTASDEVREKGFWPAIYEWLNDRGLKVITIGPKDDRLNGAYSIGKGPSPRGNFHHAVVCKNGVMVFDPHPSDDGVLEILSHDLILPMSEPEKRLWESKKVETDV